MHTCTVCTCICNCKASRLAVVAGVVFVTTMPSQPLQAAAEAGCFLTPAVRTGALDMAVTEEKADMAMEQAEAAAGVTANTSAIRADPGLLVSSTSSGVRCEATIVMNQTEFSIPCNNLNIQVLHTAHAT